MLPLRKQEPFSWVERAWFPVVDTIAGASLVLSNADRLFRRSLEALQEAFGDDDFQRGALDASSELRKLLVDDHPLLFQVRGGTDVLFQFAKTPLGQPEQRKTSFVSLYSPSPHSQIVREKAQAFLNTPVGAIDGVGCNVRNVIKYIANVRGGTHAGGHAKDDISKAMQAAEHAIGDDLGHVFGLLIREMTLIVLLAVKEVVHDAFDLSKFDGKPAAGCALLVGLMPPPPGATSFILDLGDRESRGRISVFVDQARRLTARFRYRQTDQSIKVYAALDLSPQNIVFEVGSTDGLALLSLTVGDLRLVKIISLALPASIADCTNAPVLATDREDEERAWFDMYAIVCLGHVLLPDERNTVQAYFREYVASDKGRVALRGHGPYVSNRHPRASDFGGEKPE